MSTPDEEAIKRRYRELLDLTPLVIEIAGLPPNTQGRAFTPEQMEARAQTLGNAFKAARHMVREVIKGS